MFKSNKKIKLSENLQMGVSGPAWQGTLLKTGGMAFIIASLFLAVNIYKSLRQGPAQQSEAQTGQVLGAFDQNTKTKTVNYAVQRGDTLFNIAANHGIDWSVVATMNNLEAPYALKPGQILKIPVQN